MKTLTLVCIIAISAIATAQTENPNTTTTTSVAPVSGTSTTTTTTVPTKKTFGGFVISDTTADQSGTNGAAGTNVVQSVTTVGGSYQLTDSTKLAISQSFETASNGMYQHQLNDKLNDNNFRPMHVEPAINTVLTNFLGTDRTKIDFRARLNNTNALWNSYGGATGIERHYQVSANSMVNFTPRISGTMYNEMRVFQYTDNSASRSRVSLLPGIGYSISDSLSFYQIAGYILNTKDGESLTNIRERLYLETGLNYAPAVLGGLNINLIAFQDKMISSQVDGEKVSSLNLFSANNNNDGTASNDAVVYEAILSYNF